MLRLLNLRARLLLDLSSRTDYMLSTCTLLVALPSHSKMSSYHGRARWKLSPSEGELISALILALRC